MKTKVVLGKDLEDGMTCVGFMEKTATISRVRKGRQYVNFYNDTLHANDRVGLYDEVTIVDVESEPEKLYLVCANCGEAFDSIETAHEHGFSDISGTAGWCGEDGFTILPESEAL